MKKLLKRIMALSLCACMMMGAASPVSAAEPRYIGQSSSYVYSTSGSNIKDLYIYNKDNITTDSSRSQSIYLNCLVDGQPYDGVNVTVAKFVNNDPAQSWMIYRGRDNIATIRPYTQYTNLVLYRNPNSHNASIIQFFGSTYNQDYVEIDELENTSGINMWLLSLKGKNSYLNMTSASVYGGYNVNWARNDAADNRQNWYIYEIL